jgi:hypothetical protein
VGGAIATARRRSEEAVTVERIKDLFGRLVNDDRGAAMVARIPRVTWIAAVGIGAGYQLGDGAEKKIPERAQKVSG